MYSSYSITCYAYITSISVYMHLVETYRRTSMICLFSGLGQCLCLYEKSFRKPFVAPEEVAWYLTTFVLWCHMKQCWLGLKTRHAMLNWLSTLLKNLGFWDSKLYFDLQGIALFRLTYVTRQKLCCVGLIWNRLLKIMQMWESSETLVLYDPFMCQGSILLQFTPPLAHG